jgi:hypothetical protein
MSMAEELAKLAELRSSGVLTEEEFAAHKARLLAPPASPPPATASATPADANGPRAAKTVSESLGQVMLAVPLLSTALIHLWIGSMTLLDRPQTSLVAIVVVTVLATAVLAAVEASNFGMGSETDLRPDGWTADGRPRKVVRSEGPGAWFGAIVLLWAVAFPLYLNRRARYGARSLLWPGVGVVVLMLFNAGYMNNQIDQRAEQARQQVSRDLERTREVTDEALRNIKALEEERRALEEKRKRLERGY